MSSVAVKLSEDLDCRLTALAKRRRTSRAAVMREALAALVAREEPPLTVGEIAADLIGALEGPGDLSTNPKRMEGFGQPNRPVRNTQSRAAGRKSLAKLFAESPLKGLELKTDRD
jgi:hypothetical protein